MTDIVLNAAATAQLRAQKEPAKLIGADGTYLGQFDPIQAFGRMTEEEIAEAIAEPDEEGVEWSEILSDLKREQP